MVDSVLETKSSRATCISRRKTKPRNFLVLHSTLLCFLFLHFLIFTFTSKHTPKPWSEESLLPLPFSSPSSSSSPSRARNLPNLVTELKPDSEPGSHHPEPKTVSFTIDPVPLTLLRYRPINRHFQPGRPLPLSLRTTHRRCRHGHRREIPYGNYVILLGDAAAAAARLIHQRWVSVHSAAETRLPATVARLYSDREHHHRGENDHHHHHKHQYHRLEESWFAKKIRKFMNLF